MKAVDLIEALRHAVALYGEDVEVYMDDWAEKYAWPTPEIALRHAAWHERNTPACPRHGLVLHHPDDGGRWEGTHDPHAL